MQKKLLNHFVFKIFSLALILFSGFIAANAQCINPKGYLTLAAGATYSQGFEGNWINSCATHDVPDTNWVNTPATSNDSWRRDDDGASSNWPSAAYTNLYYSGGPGNFYGVSINNANVEEPFGSNANGASSNYSARFHGIGDYYTPGSVATLDLYLDLSQAGSETVAYDFLNTGDANGIQVLLSTNGGSTFSQIDIVTSSLAWARRTVNIATSSATCIIRFKCVSNDVDYDKAIDNVSVTSLAACTGAPTASAITPVNPHLMACSSSQTFSLATNYSGLQGIAYQWQQSSNGITYTAIAGATNATYTGTFTTGISYVNCIIKCTNTSTTTTSTPDTVTYSPKGYLPVTVATPYIQGFENTWLSKCSTDDIPDSNWLSTPVTGDNSWRRDDDGAVAVWLYPDYGNGNYFGSSPAAYIPGGNVQPTGSNANGASSSHSARFHSLGSSFGDTGNMDLYLDLSAPGTKTISYDFINNGTSQGLKVSLSTTGPTGTFMQVSSITTASAWTTTTFTTTTTSANCVLRFKATADANDDMGLDNVSVNIIVPCAGTPAQATVNPGSVAITACNSNNSQLFSLVDNYGSTTGLTYQWQRSTDGITYTPVSGATDTTYTGAFAGSITYVNCIVTCTNSSTAKISDTVTVTNTPQSYLAVTAASPYTQGFENQWINKCNTHDAPDTYWMNTPSTGNNSFRRDDDGSDAAWNSPPTGVYSPTGSNANGASSAHSARFHSAGTSASGVLDLYLNTSALSTVQISYDYINTSGTDNVTMLLSTTGPTGTFTQLDHAITSASWATRTVTTTSISATCVLRFIVAGGGSTDIGIDNVSVAALVACSGAPAAGTVSPSTASVTACSPSQALTLSGISAGVTGITYQWEQSINGGTNFTPVTGATNTTYTGSFTAASTLVYCKVTCTSSGLSTSSDTATITLTPQAYFAVSSAAPYTQGFENTWISRCATDDAPDIYWVNTPAIGNNSWRRDDNGASATWASGTLGAYTPAGSNASGASSTHSARFHTSGTTAGITGVFDLYLNLNTPGGKQIVYDYINASGADSLKVLLSTTGPTGTFTPLDKVVTSANWTTRTLTTNTTSTTCVLRFVATSDSGTTDIGIDNVAVRMPEGVTNINGNSQFGINAYPNPANNIVTVRAYGMKGDNSKVSLTDITGRVINTINMATDRVEFNMSNLAPGIYLVRYEDNVHTSIIKVNKQ